ncbi:MAG: response regulator [Flavobacteriales bacterium]|nr:response regulator [Flavobacteriales bacterium]
MKHEEKILTDYYGALYYIKENKDNELTIFIVDDDLFYLHLLEKELSKNSKFEIFTFTTGEQCLNALQLNPDLVILDYHLDGKQSYPKNGDVIAKEIKKRLPKTETIIISSDHKLALVGELNRPTILFKDGFVKEKIQSMFLNILKKRKDQWLQNAIFPTLILSFLLICIIIYLKL